MIADIARSNDFIYKKFMLVIYGYAIQNDHVCLILTMTALLINIAVWLMFTIDLTTF